MLTNFENFISDYQMVECFRYFDTIFSEIRNFFDREITDLFMSRINRHPVQEPKVQPFGPELLWIDS